MYEKQQPWAFETEQTLNCDIRVVFKEVWSGGGEGSNPHPKDRETPLVCSPLLHSHQAGEALGCSSKFSADYHTDRAQGQFVHVS